MSETSEFEHASNIQKSIEDIIGAKTIVKKRRKTQDDYKKELFDKIILNLESIDTRNNLAEIDLGLDLHEFNKSYEETIDFLLIFTFGKEATKMIYYYLFEYYNNDGSHNIVMSADGKTEIPLHNSTDLWNAIQKMDQTIPKKYN